MLEWLDGSPPGEFHGTIVSELGVKIRQGVARIVEEIHEGHIVLADLPEARGDACGGTHRLS